MAELVPLECPRGHRLPVRLESKAADLTLSARCPRCDQIHEGRVVVRVVVGYTVLRLS